MSTFDITPYEESRIRELAASELERMSFNPAPYRPRGLARLWEDDPTLEEETEWHRAQAALLRAKAGTFREVINVARVLHEVGELPRMFRHDDQLREARFANELKLESLRALEIEAREAELKERIHRSEAAIARDKRESAGEELERGVKEFANELGTRNQMRRMRDEAIAKVRRSRMSREAKQKRIEEIEQLYTNKTAGEY